MLNFIATFTTIQDIQDYASLIIWEHTVFQEMSVVIVL